MNSDRNAKHILIDHDRLPYYLHLRRTDVDALVAAGLIAEETEKRIPIRRINYGELAREYQRMIDSGEYPSRASVARSLGVSRAWVWKVMRRGGTTDRTCS